MLTIYVPSFEVFDSIKNEFIPVEGKSLSLEHSLVSISKWESKWHKSFLGTDQKTNEELIDYVRCMTLTKNVDPLIYYRLSDDNLKAIEKYISDPMTATTFSDDKQNGGIKGRSKKIITAEIIYYWMIALNIPMECQKWHLNRLITLIRVVDIKSQPSKKMKGKALLDRNRKLNAARRKAMGTQG